MKSKKVLTILLSLAIMVTFMPTFAFAATGDTSSDYNDVQPYNHHYSEVPDATLSTPATCSNFGVNVYKCDVNTKIENSEGVKVAVGCNAQKRKLTEGTHKYQKVRITVAEALQILIEQGDINTTNDLNQFLTATAGKCYAFVDQCTVCNEYNITLNGIGQADWQGHVAPANPACAETYTCETCNETVTRNVATGNHNWKYSWHTSQRNIVRDWEYVGTNCANGENNGVRMYKNVCEDCGKEVIRSFAYGTPVHTGTIIPKYTASQWADLDTTTKNKISAYLVEYDGNYYEPNAFDEDGTAPTCLADSSEGYGYLVCPDCGLQLGNNSCKVEKTGHTPVSVSTTATCTQDGWDVTYCAVCGNLIKEKKNADKATGHSYKVTVVAEPTIYDDGITLIECEKCGQYMTNRTADVAHEAHQWNTGWDPRVRNSKNDNTGDWYFIGFEREFYDTTDASKPRITEDAIKLDSWTQLTPHFTAYATMAEASCTLPEIQAMKDTVSGDFYVHALKTIGKPLGHDKTTFEVKATCGDYGYKYDACKRCGYLLKNGKTTDYTTEDLKIDGAINLGVAYDLQDPVVLLGTPCEYAWGSLDDETEALICSKCGAVKAGSETPKTDDAKKAAQVEKAKPIIEAAANILAESDVYTADSVAAIEEAKANLNSAIAAGTSTDVKNMAAELQKAVDGAQLKAANTMTASGKTITAKKNATKTFKKSKAFKVKSAKGKVTFAKKSGKAKIVVAKNGKVTVKKGLKKGTYKVKVAVTAAGNGNYLPKTKVVTLKVKVK
jgi:hypothetical protein